jgi:hypothetical protein
LVSPRLKVLILPLILFSITLLGLFFSAINQVTSNPVFWGAFVLFFLIGAFLLLPEDPIPGKRRKTGRVGYLTLAAILFALLFVSRWIPDAVVVGVGYVGLPSGAGARGLYYLLFDSRWDYCPKCARQSWITKRNGKWYCTLKGHVVSDFNSSEFH